MECQQKQGVSGVTIWKMGITHSEFPVFLEIWAALGCRTLIEHYSSFGEFWASIATRNEGLIPWWGKSLEGMEKVQFCVNLWLTSD